MIGVYWFTGPFSALAFNQAKYKILLHFSSNSKTFREPVIFTYNMGENKEFMKKRSIFLRLRLR